MATVTVQLGRIEIGRFREMLETGIEQAIEELGQAMREQFEEGRISHEVARAALEQDILAHATVPEVIAVREVLRAGRLYNSALDCVIAIIAQCRGTSYERIRMRSSVFETWLSRIPRSRARPEESADAAVLDAWLTAWIDDHTLETGAAPDPPLLADREPIDRAPARPAFYRQRMPGSYMYDGEWSPVQRIEP